MGEISAPIDIIQPIPIAAIVTPSIMMMGRLERTQMIGIDVIKIARIVCLLAVSKAIPRVIESMKIKNGLYFFGHVIIAYPRSGAESAKSMPI